MCSRPLRPLGLPIYVARVPAAPFSRSYPRHFTFYVAHPFVPFSRDDVGIGEVGAVFEAWKARPLLHPRYGVFELEPSRWETSETDGQVERPTKRERRSQHVEISLESPASPVAALRVALD